MIKLVVQRTKVGNRQSLDRAWDRLHPSFVTSLGGVSDKNASSLGSTIPQHIVNA